MGWIEVSVTHTAEEIEKQRGHDILSCNLYELLDQLHSFAEQTTEEYFRHHPQLNLVTSLKKQNDVSYALQYRFVRLDSLGRETVYPFSLSCSTESPWNPREIVCEDNYMEVSVRKNVPVIAQEGLEKEDWEAALSIVSELSTGIGGGTVPSEKGFTVTLGNFKPDVELKNLTLNGVPLTLPEAQNRGVKISEVLHPNGTKDFVLKVPFDNPLVSVEVRINPTRIRSFCTNRSVVFEVTPGNMDSSWELCIGSRPLPYTIAETKITIELPLFSIGYIYEDISLRGLTVRVELNMRNVKTLQVEKQFVQRCPIPIKCTLCSPTQNIQVEPAMGHTAAIPTVSQVEPAMGHTAAIPTVSQVEPAMGHTAAIPTVSQVEPAMGHTAAIPSGSLQRCCMGHTAAIPTVSQAEPAMGHTAAIPTVSQAEPAMGHTAAIPTVSQVEPAMDHTAAIPTVSQVEPAMDHTAAIPTVSQVEPAMGHTAAPTTESQVEPAMGHTAAIPTVSQVEPAMGHTAAIPTVSQVEPAMGHTAAIPTVSQVEPAMGHTAAIPSGSLQRCCWGAGISLLLQFPT
ncbi:UNVERIFIED_CONTAM: hypothetical protein FKN15_070289 [Acipenser sinensis]